MKMLKKQKRKDQSQQSSQMPGCPASESKKSRADSYLKTRRFLRKVNTCKISLYGYAHTANIIRWSDEETSERWYSILYDQWYSLQKRVYNIIRSRIFESESLSTADAHSIFIAMVALYLTDYDELADDCLRHLMSRRSPLTDLLAWSGHDKPIVALMISMINGKESFSIEDFRHEKLYEEVQEIWHFEDGIDAQAKQEFAQTCSSRSDPANFHPFSSNQSNRKDTNQMLRELCMAVMDKYEVDYAHWFPDNTPIPVCEVVRGRSRGIDA